MILSFFLGVCLFINSMVAGTLTELEPRATSMAASMGQAFKLPHETRSDGKTLSRPSASLSIGDRNRCFVKRTSNKSDLANREFTVCSSGNQPLVTIPAIH